MTRYKWFGASRTKKGLSLVDLIISILVASIVLIGVYKAFLSNIKTTTGSIDLAALDNRTRKTVEILQADIASLNGNIINGLPTLFPTFSDSGAFNGFVLLSAEKMLPVLEMAQDTFSLSDSGISTVSLRSSALGNETNDLAVKEGMLAFLYNYKNYAWIPFKIIGKSEKTDDKFSVDLIKLQGVGSNWFDFLSTPKCLDYMNNKNFGDNEKICDSNNDYQKSNTTFIIGNSVEYKFDSASKTIYRISNNDSSNTTVLAQNVTHFEPRFVMEPTTAYDDVSIMDPEIVDLAAKKILIENKNEITTFIQNLVPDPEEQANDDCKSQFNYKCLDESGNLNALAYGYASSRIGAVDITLSMQTESERSKSLRFFISLDENHGNTSITAFTPSKIIASKRSSEARPFGSTMATPAYFSDPEGGSLQPFFTAVAPMTSAVYKNNDDPENDYSMLLCKTNPTIFYNCANWKVCYESSNEAERLAAGCLNPQGSLNDRGLNADNRIDPKLVFINGNARIQDTFTYDLSRYCTGSKCPLNSFYHNLEYGDILADTVFPMTVVPRFDSNGNLMRLYVGAARLRYPNKHRDLLPFHNYDPFYHSTVFAINPVPDPANPTSTTIRDDVTDYRLDELGIYEDIASVSSLSFRDEGDKTYMYLSSHETNGLIYRERNATSNDDRIGTPTGWSTTKFAFKDTTPEYIKYTWKMPIPGYDQAILHTFGPYTRSGAIVSHHAHKDGRIYYCTNQLMPDEPINGPTSAGTNQWFYNHAVTYKSPIIHPSDGRRYSCDPTINDSNNPQSWLYQHPTLGEVCKFAQNTPKPIDWSICKSDPTAKDDGNCWLDQNQRPVATDILPDYSARLMVAFKVADDQWETKKIANMHGTCTGITSDPITGNLVVSSANNIKVFSYNEVNATLAGANVTPYIDMGFRRDDERYTANNVVSSLTSPESPNSDIEFRKISGTNIFSDPKNLKMVFTDTLKREVGFIIQQRNNSENELFAQIVYNPLAPHDANFDLSAIHTKDKVDIGPKFAKWLLPFESTASWADTEHLVNEQVEYHLPSPIPAKPPWYVAKREVNPSDPTESSCLFKPPPVPQPLYGCGQDYYWRECAADVLSQASMGITSFQVGSWGCGIGYPSPTEDPSMASD